MAKVTAKQPEPESVGVSVRLPSLLLAQIDSLAGQERRTRGNVIRLLLEDALALKAATREALRRAMSVSDHLKT
jgi:metal-responsive CopG/Arc/MetJ family transcriptional regulator